MNLKNKLLGQQHSIDKTTMTIEEKDEKVYIVSVVSIFPHEKNKFFTQEKIIANTLRITKPLSTIKLLNGQDHDEWQEGYTYKMKVLSYGIMAIGGVHHITVDQIDHLNGKIITTEYNNIAPIWNHTLSFSEEGPGITKYEDRIVLKTKFLNKIFARYLVMFYKKRHRNWNKLLNEFG